MFVIGCAYVKIEDNSYKELYKLKQITTNAIVISEPQVTDYRVKYTIKIIDDSVLNNKKFIIQLKKSDEILPYGALIKFSGKYNKPSVARNAGGFDYSNYLKTKKIYGVIECSDVKVLKNENINIISSAINNFKNIIINNSKQIIKNTNASGILIGLLIGDTKNIDEDIVNDFKDSSLAHLLAVSGQHVTYIIIAIGFVLNVIRTGKRASYFVCIIIIILFVLLTGASSAVLRAGIMGILVLLAKIMYRKADFCTSLALSSIIIFCINPFAIYDIGLWLSYRWDNWNCVIK